MILKPQEFRLRNNSQLEFMKSLNLKTFIQCTLIKVHFFHASENNNLLFKSSCFIKKE